MYKYKRLVPEIALCVITFVGVLLFSGQVFAEESYPSRTVRIIDAFPPGGSTDVLGRVLAQEMSETFGQPFVVENRPGAAGNIGTDHVAKSKPDGYTLGIAPNQTVAVNPMLYQSCPLTLLKT